MLALLFILTVIFPKSNENHTITRLQLHSEYTLFGIHADTGKEDYICVTHTLSLPVKFYLENEFLTQSYEKKCVQRL